MTNFTMFTLQPWDLNYQEDLVRNANNKDIARYMTDMFPHPYTIEHAQAFIQMATNFDPNRIFAIIKNDHAIGSIGIHLQQDILCKNAELGYWLSESYWGQGIITQAVRQMVDYGFDTFDIQRIFARPFGRNLGSQRVLEKAGFQLEARLENTIFKWGEYDDELIYAIRRPGQ